MAAHIVSVSGDGHRRTDEAADLLGAEGLEQVAAETYRWIKSLRHVPYAHGSQRDAFTYRGESLWWFTELYLHKTRRMESAVKMVLALMAAREQHDPASVEVATANPAEQAAAQAFARMSGLPVTCVGPKPIVAEPWWPSYRIGVTTRVTRWRPSPRVVPASPQIAAFVHTAFWSDGRSDGRTDGGGEAYIGPVLAALTSRLPAGALAFVGLGPRRNFRARKWWDPVLGRLKPPSAIAIERLAPRRTVSSSLQLWRDRHRLAEALTAGPAVREAAVVLRCDLWEVLRPELLNVARLQWPWSARAMDEAGAALDRLAPRVAVTYAEAGGWGRALALEARRRGIPLVGLQHGFIYRHWLNYRHEPDELEPHGGERGFPYPDRTLVFDGFASKYLREAGRLPGGTLRITGNPRLDSLLPAFRAARQERRAQLRAGIGAAPGDQVVLLTAKWSEIRDDLPELFRAANERDTLRLVVKTHPAETEEGYRAQAAGLRNIRVVAARTPLADLLAAADLLVTKNSTVAIDALLLGLPALVIGLPSNLSPFVDAGVMMGARNGEVRQRLEAVLYDQSVRARLLEASGQFLETERMAADGRAAERAANEILRVAE